LTGVRHAPVATKFRGAAKMTRCSLQVRTDDVRQVRSLWLGTHRERRV